MNTLTNEEVYVETSEEVKTKAKPKNVTKHFTERWAERVLKITDTNTAKSYIGSNREKIIADANKSFEYATYLYTGQIGDNTTKNYYIKDDMIFVTNTDDSAFVTIYKTDFGFTEEINTTLRKELIEHVQKLQNEKYEAEFVVQQELEDKKQQMSLADEEIKLAEEQLKILKESRKFMDEEIRNIQKKSINVGLELKKYINHLVNSKEYKNDLGKM